MSPLFRILLIVVSLGTFVGMIKRIRNAKVQIETSLFWLIFSAILLVLSLFPQIPAVVSEILGMYSTANLIFLVVIFVLLLHQFRVSVKMSQLEQKLKELTQELAVRELSEKEKEC